VSRVLSSLSKPASLLFGACAQIAAVAAFADGSVPAGHSFAAPTAIGQPSVPSVGGLGQVTLALLIVLGAVFAVAWVVKRMRGFGNRVGNAIDVIADIPLGQKERAVLLKVGKVQILIGVAPGQVNTLHVLAEPIDLTPPAASPTDSRPTFKQLMMRSLGK
jgi:flagellar protein FliO/FliZ